MERKDQQRLLQVGRFNITQYVHQVIERAHAQQKWVRADTTRARRSR